MSFPRWSVWAFACLLLAATFSGVAAQGDAAPAAIPAEAQRNHIIVLVDQSGSFQRLVRGEQLTNLLSTRLPEILTDSQSLKGQKIYHPERDVLSVMLFGITTEYPRIDSGLLRDVFLFEDRTRLEDLSSSNIGWRGKRAGLTAISAVFGMALDRIGSEYRRLGLETVFNKTYVVRISDDQHNSSGGYYGELTTIQRFRNTTLFPPEVLGFMTVYQKLADCDTHIEIMNPDHTWLVSLTQGGGKSWNPDDYVTPAGEYPVKVLITEARPRAHVSFDAIFESRTPGELKHYTRRPVSATATFRLKPEYRQSHPDLIALGWRRDILYLGESAWERGEVQPLSPDSTIECEVIQRDDALPTSMDFMAFFGRTDPYLGRGLFQVQKRLTYYEETSSQVEKLLMSVCPFEGLSKDWVFGGFVTLLVLILLAVVFGPRRAILAIEPVPAASDEPTRIVVDLDDSSEHPMIVGFAERYDTNYHRPRLRRSAKIRDFFYNLRSKRTSGHLQFGEEVTTTGKTAVLRNVVQLALPRPIGELRFSSDETMALRLLPRSIVDLTESGRQYLVGTTGVTRESTLELDFDGRFGWTQGRRRKGHSSKAFRARLVLRPRRNHARMAVHEAGPIEFASDRKHVIAVVDMDSLAPDFNYITDMDVSLEAELKSLGTALVPELSFEIIPAEIASIAVDLKQALSEWMKSQDEADAHDSQIEAVLTEIESAVKKLLTERVISLGADSPIADIHAEVLSEIEAVVKEVLAELTEGVISQSADSSIADIHAGVLSEIETAVGRPLDAPKTTVDEDNGSNPVDPGLEEILSGTATAVKRLLSDRKMSLVADSHNESQAADGSLVSEEEAGNQPVDESGVPKSILPTPKVVCHNPGGSHASGDIRGRIGPQGLQLAITATFTELRNIKSQIEYDLHLSVPVGRDQLDLLGEDGEKAIDLPVVRVTFEPSHRLATARVEYAFAGSPPRIVNLLKLKRDGVIDANRSGPQPKAVLPHGGKWLKPVYPTLILGNNARSGEGRVEFTIRFTEATVATGIGRVDEHPGDLRHAIHVDIQKAAHGPAPRDLPERFNLAQLDDRTTTISSAEGDARLRLSFDINPSDLNLGEDDENVKVELGLPLTIVLDNPGADDEMSGEERIRLIIPFYLHRKPARGLLSVDFGTSAIAVAYSDDMVQAELLNLQESRRALDPKNLFLINDEPLNESRFLSGPLGYYSQAGQQKFSDEEKKFFQPSGVAFPATRKFRDYPEYLIPHLKMLLASGVNDIRLGQNNQIRVTIHDLLMDALDRLLREFVLKQVEVVTDRNRGDILRDLRRIVMTVPNTSLGHQTRMLKDALPQENGFRFAEDYITFLSESDAAAYGYLYQHATQETLEAYGESFTLLVYDCGAGTLDLSLRTVKIDRDSATNELRPSSKLISLLSIEGGGNALDGKIMECVDEKLKSAGKVNELKDKYSFKVNYYPFDPLVEVCKKNIPVGHWREYMDIIKRGLYYTKKRLSEDMAKGEIAREDLEVLVGFEKEATHRMFDIDDRDGLEPEALDTIRSHGITFGENTGNPTVVVPYKVLQDKLSEENGFYHDHIDLPLEALLLGPDGTMVWPDVILLTGRTALFPGFRERLEEWFASTRERLQEERTGHEDEGAEEKQILEDKESIPDETPESVPGNGGPRVPEFVSFENDPEKMKSIVVQGALAYAGSGRRTFETTEVYGHYGLLVHENNRWHWHPVCSHHTVQKAKDDSGNMVPCGYCSVQSVMDICFVYSSIDPTPMIEKYNADQNRPIADRGPLWAYRHFLKQHDSATGDLIREKADEDAGNRGGLRADTVQFYGSFVRDGRILNVSVDLQIGGEVLRLSTDGGSARREQYSVWPYNLWSSA